MDIWCYGIVKKLKRGVPSQKKLEAGIVSAGRQELLCSIRQFFFAGVVLLFQRGGT